MLTLHHSQLPCLHDYPFKSSCLAFVPVPFRHPGPPQDEEGPWVPQWGPKVATKAGPPSWLPLSTWSSQLLV